MNVRYVNHQGESINLDDDKIILQYQELYDYSWDTESKNGKITGFYRENATIPISVSVTADTEEEYLKILNDFFTVTEKDIMTLRNGKLYLGNQYLSCFISGSIKEDAFMGVPFQIKNLTLITDHPFWITEQHIQLLPSSRKTPEKQGLGFPFDFAFDFAPKKSGSETVRIDHYKSSDFKMIMYGPCIDPVLKVNDYPYQIYTTLKEGEYLEIDSRANTVMKYAADGTTESLYNSRAFEHSVFEKIPAGGLRLIWNGGFGIDITLFLERSEPKW